MFIGVAKRLPWISGRWSWAEVGSAGGDGGGGGGGGDCTMLRVRCGGGDDADNVLCWGKVCQACIIL